MDEEEETKPRKDVGEKPPLMPKSPSLILLASERRRSRYSCVQNRDTAKPEVDNMRLSVSQRIKFFDTNNKLTSSRSCCSFKQQPSKFKNFCVLKFRSENNVVIGITIKFILSTYHKNITY